MNETTEIKRQTNCRLSKPKKVIRVRFTEQTQHLYGYLSRKESATTSNVHLFFTSVTVSPSSTFLSSPDGRLQAVNRRQKVFLSGNLLISTYETTLQHIDGKSVTMRSLSLPSHPLLRVSAQLIQSRLPCEGHIRSLLLLIGPSCT